MFPKPEKWPQRKAVTAFRQRRNASGLQRLILSTIDALSGMPRLCLPFSDVLRSLKIAPVVCTPVLPLVAIILVDVKSRCLDSCGVVSFVPWFLHFCSSSAARAVKRYLSVSTVLTGNCLHVRFSLGESGGGEGYFFVVFFLDIHSFVSSFTLTTCMKPTSHLMTF